jgi:hypothetical protein
MDKKDYIIVGLVLLIAVFITTKINSCNDPVYTTSQRDSTDQRVIDSLKVLRQEINRLIEIQDSALTNNQIGLEANKIYFIKVMNDFLKVQKVKKSLPLDEQWNNYLKELENE